MSAFRVRPGLFAFVCTAAVAGVAGVFVQAAPPLSPTPGSATPAPQVARADDRTRTTTVDDQTELAVTVYNSNVALVRDVRSFQMPAGVFNLQFMDIAATVNPATVHFRSLTEPGRVSVLEQNYEYDLLEPDKLLRKYVGKDVTLVRTRQDNGTSRQEEVRAHLLSYNTQPVWQIGNEIVTGLGAESIRFPALPDNLFVRPTLIWTLDNSGATTHRVEASYLAGNLSWNADYVLTVGRDDKLADLNGWVTLVNGSGTSFNNATLQLVAGDLNRVRQMSAANAERSLRAMAEDSAKMAQESFSEYHLYTLPRKTSINNSQTKQVSMLDGSGVPVVKKYTVNGQAFFYRNVRQPGVPLKDEVQVYYTFRNSTQSGLGQPMPGGTVRVYQADSRGGVQFAGEDNIPHTPADENISIKIGNAFDVVCERNQVDFTRLSQSPNIFEVEYTIKLRNHKTTPITVDVNEPIGGSWRMLRSTHAWTKTAAFAAQFNVPVPANGEAVLTYRVQVS